MTFKKSLTSILRNLLTDAYGNRGRECKKTLDKGLTIRIYITKEQRVNLMLQRNNVLPGMEEWRTVLACWPWPLPETWPTPQERHHGTVHGLTASWPMLDEKYQKPVATVDAAEVGV